MSRWFFVKVIVASTHKGDPGWRPTFVFFECDSDVKGLALFSSADLAEEFSAQMVCSLPREVAELGGDGVLVKDYVISVACHVRAVAKALALPVYVDPPDNFCKGDVRPAFKTLERYFLKHKLREVPWEFAVVGLALYKGYTTMLLKHDSGKVFVAQTMKGEFPDRESMTVAVEDAIGTTEECHYNRTAPMPDPGEAVQQARRFIDRESTR